MKNKIASLLLTFLCLSVVTSCNTPSKHTLADTEIKVQEISQKRAEENGIKNCLCPELWLPVCGDNGKTYSNSCFAQCAGVHFKPGSCAKIITD